MKDAVIEKTIMSQVSINWKLESDSNEPEPEKQEPPKEEPKDPYWKDYNEFLVNLA